MPLVTPPTTTAGPRPDGRDARNAQAHNSALRLRLHWPRTRQTPWEQFCTALAEEKQLVERLLQ